jgi:acyl-CoA reductase-like NAD-dependent aldehyde dehydrogenase
MATQQIISPIDGSLVAERATIAPSQLEAVLQRASAAQREWRHVPLAERAAICERMVEYKLDHVDDLAQELTRQMGRPIRYAPMEIKRGFQERARHMSAIAPAALADIAVEPKDGFTRFIRKDPSYVRPDCDLDYAIAENVDGAFFNSGQSCCAIQRIYVHQDIYAAFVEGFVELTRKYQLGNPLDPDVTIGPLVHTKAAEFVRGQIADAIAQGARALTTEADFAQSQAGTPYLGPTVLVDVNHDMRVMHAESFGPVIGIMPVRDDEAAIRLMNDSPYGLTASIWTNDTDAAIRIGDQIATGTWYMNRCDYLDPALAWTGLKDTGRGCTLSVLGFDALTRPKSFHLKHVR